MATPIELLPPDFHFKPAVPEVPLLARYDRPAPQKFWNKFPKDTNFHKASPYVIDTKVLSKWVAKLNPSSMMEVLLEEVVHDLEFWYWNSKPGCGELAEAHSESSVFGTKGQWNPGVGLNVLVWRIFIS